MFVFWEPLKDVKVQVRENEHTSTDHTELSRWSNRPSKDTLTTELTYMCIIGQLDVRMLYMYFYHA